MWNESKVTFSNARLSEGPCDPYQYNASHTHLPELKETPV
jgi:hypothetical protein